MKSSDLILIIDAERTEAQTLQKVLRDGEIENPLVTLAGVDDAKRYLHGADQYQSRRAFPFPGLVLLSLVLPFDWSFDLLKWIRSQIEMQTLPIIAVGAAANSPAVQRAYNLGANAYFQRGIDFRKLVNTIGALEGMEEILARFPRWATA